MRIPFASITMDIAYNEEKAVTIRRFPTKYETEKLKKSKYKLVDEEIYASDNQIELNMFYNTRRKQVNVISGGLWDFKEGGRYGIDIDLKMSQPEKELNDYLSSITRQLCEKHLKPCVLFQSRYSINCQIDECRLTEEIVKRFFEDFVMALEGTIDEFKVVRKEKKIEETAEEQVRKIEEKEKCSDCGKDLKFSKIEHWFDEDSGEVINVCPDCWSKRRQMGRDLGGSKKEKTWSKEGEIKPALEEVTETKPKKMAAKWKVILIVLTIIACITIGLVAKAFLGI